MSNTISVIIVGVLAFTAMGIMFTAQLRAGKQLVRQVQQDYGLTVKTSTMANAITGGGTIVQVNQYQVLVYDSVNGRMNLQQLATV